MCTRRKHEEKLLAIAGRYAWRGSAGLRPWSASVQGDLRAYTNFRVAAPEIPHFSRHRVLRGAPFKLKGLSSNFVGLAQPQTHCSFPRLNEVARQSPIWEASASLSNALPRCSVHAESTRTCASTPRDRISPQTRLRWVPKKKSKHCE